MKRINDLAIEKGIRDKIIICAGGTQVIPEEAVKTGIDMGFGRNSHGIDVATFLAQEEEEEKFLTDSDRKILTRKIKTNYEVSLLAALATWEPNSGSKLRQGANPLAYC